MVRGDPLKSNTGPHEERMSCPLGPVLGLLMIMAGPALTLRAGTYVSEERLAAGNLHQAGANSPARCRFVYYRKISVNGRLQTRPERPRAAKALYWRAFGDQPLV